jgi:16S rRNA U1498 N3-methylase RsmE
MLSCIPCRAALAGPARARTFSPVDGPSCRIARRLPPTFRSSTARGLNRLLFRPTELDPAPASGSPSVTLPKDDYRTVHAARILVAETGSTLRAGIVGEDRDGRMTDRAVVEWLSGGSSEGRGTRASGDDPPGALRIHLESLQEAPEPLASPPVSLLLALPRPLQLARMLPMIAQLGVDQLVLTEARKVPKDYFGSHLLREPGLLTDRLVEGLCQAGDVRLPSVRVVRRLRRFLEEGLDDAFPPDTHARVVAHPRRSSSDPSPPLLLRMRQVRFPSAPSSAGRAGRRRMLVAVGPEGGWDEPGEIERLARHGFQVVTLGERTLRSDCAVVSLLALAHDACDPPTG